MEWVGVCIVGRKRLRMAQKRVIFYHLAGMTMFFFEVFLIVPIFDYLFTPLTFPKRE